MELAAYLHYYIVSSACEVCCADSLYLCAQVSRTRHCCCAFLRGNNVIVLLIILPYRVHVKGYGSVLSTSYVYKIYIGRAFKFNFRLASCKIIWFCGTTVSFFYGRNWKLVAMQGNRRKQTINCETKSWGNAGWRIGLWHTDVSAQLGLRRFAGATTIN